MATPNKKGKIFTEMMEQEGFTPDQYGHYTWFSRGVRYRIKIQKTSWRGEVKQSWGWSKLTGGFYGQTGCGDSALAFYKNHPEDVG